MATQTRTRQTRRNRPAVVEAPTPEVAPVEEEVVAPTVEVEPTPTEEPATPKKPKAAPLTLSQRRALLRLQQNDAWTPPTAFAALPYEHLVAHGLATAELDSDGPTRYVATDAGRARTINPGYADWQAGETVAADPTRPPHGSKLRQRDTAIDVLDVAKATWTQED